MLHQPWLRECVLFVSPCRFTQALRIPSDNIIIAEDTSKHSILPRPYLIEFNTARLEGYERLEKVDVDIEAHLYQHPNYQSSSKANTSYTRQHNIYSLKMVLLEISNRSSIKEIGSSRMRAYDAKQSLKKIKVSGVDYLSFMVGSIFKRADE